MCTINIFQEKITQQGHCSNINEYVLLIDSFIFIQVWYVWEEFANYQLFHSLILRILCLTLSEVLFCFCFSKPLMNNWDSFLTSEAVIFDGWKIFCFISKAFKASLHLKKDWSTSSSMEWIVLLRYKYCSILQSV